MGYIKAVVQELLTLPSDPAYWVRMKSKASYSDTSAAQAAMLKVVPEDKKVSVALKQGNGTVPPGVSAESVLTELELDAYLHTLIARMVVEWNVTDEKDRTLPISAESVGLLTPDDGNFLSVEAQKRIGGRPPAQQDPFGNQSGQSSTALPSQTKRRKQ